MPGRASVENPNRALSALQAKPLHVINRNRYRPTLPYTQPQLTGMYWDSILAPQETTVHDHLPQPDRWRNETAKWRPWQHTMT
jgi:hypothetical protein